MPIEENINKFFYLIIKEKHSFVKTKNTYERLCLYSLQNFK